MNRLIFMKCGDEDDAHVWMVGAKFLGEFGAYEKADLASRIRYDSYVARAAEMHGLPWVYWQFDSDFIVYDVDRDRWVEPILNALIPPDGNAATQTR